MKSSRQNSLLLIFVLIFSALNAPAQTSTAAIKPPEPGREPSARGRVQSSQAEIEGRINALLAQMTLEEKLGQLQILDGEADGKYRPEHLEMIRKGQLGSTLNVRGAKRTNELQRIAVEQSRLKIPVLFGFDVIHGYRTIFPISLGLASSWDPAAVERAASIAAAES